jgi:multidrug resistance efflux pump
VAAAGVILLLLWPLGAPADPRSPAPPRPGPGRPADIAVPGKLFAALKRQVTIPFHGIVTSVTAKPGQPVKAGDELARFSLAPEVALQLRRRVNPTLLKELEMQMAGLEKNLEHLQAKLKELRLLVQQKMASAESLNQVEREVQHVLRQRDVLKERLDLEGRLAREDRELLTKQLGGALVAGRIPREAPVITPIAGHVLWVNPECRVDAELGPGSPVAVVAVLNPMRIRALVYENEALQLKPGDAAEFALESLAGRKFPARVMSVPWTPTTPALDQPSYYEVELEVANPEYLLKEGLKGVVTFGAPAQTPPG